MPTYLKCSSNPILSTTQQQNFSEWHEVEVTAMQSSLLGVKLATALKVSDSFATSLVLPNSTFFSPFLKEERGWLPAGLLGTHFYCLKCCRIYKLLFHKFSYARMVQRQSFKFIM